MPEILESLLWCAALATWLMLFFMFVGDSLKPLSKRVGHLLQEAFWHRAK